MGRHALPFEAGTLMTGLVAATKNLWGGLLDRTNAYLGNDDPLAANANAGAFLVWGNQPFYPIYVWFLVGAAAWPSLLTWLSTPFFIAVPLVARRSSRAGRALFVVAGAANTLLATKAFGLETDVGWFLLPCFILAVGFFRASEWKLGAGLAILILVAGVAMPHLGTPIAHYHVDQARSLSRLNLWSVGVLSIYLAYAAFRARRPKTS